ncbi:hypothetical protein DXG03_002267, partial [Asterophora parasitica]
SMAATMGFLCDKGLLDSSFVKLVLEQEGQSEVAKLLRKRADKRHRSKFAIQHVKIEASGAEILDALNS